MPNPMVAVLLHAADARACVADGARPGFGVRYDTCVDQLLETLRTLAVALVIIDAADAQGRSMGSAIAAIRHGFPSVPVLAYCPMPSGRSDVVVDVVRAGATGLILRGIDDTRPAMRAAILSARRGSVARRIHDEVALHLPPAALPLLRYAVSRAGDEPSVEDAAASLGVDRKTLFNWLRDCGQVRPREFINWVRLAIVVGMLEDPGAPPNRPRSRPVLRRGPRSGTCCTGTRGCDHHRLEVRDLWKACSRGSSRCWSRKQMQTRPSRYRCRTPRYARRRSTAAHKRTAVALEPRGRIRRFLMRADSPWCIVSSHGEAARPALARHRRERCRYTALYE